METTINPVYIVGGSKGGVGKSIVALALADHL
jgi:cellulose biosynthesis protein BcsQ